MEENNKKGKFKKRASAVTAALLVIALLLTGTYAYIALGQHDSNEAMGSGTKYDATLNEEYEPPTDWKVSDPAVSKKINVTNTGLTDGTYGDVYIRVQLREYMEIAPISYVYYDVNNDGTPDLYMTNPDGSYVIFDTQTDAQTAYPGHTVAELTDAVSGQTGWFVQTQAGDMNGQYGKYVIKEFTSGTAGSLVSGVTRATDADYGEEGHNGECDYTLHVWDENVTGYSDTELFLAYVKWTLGDDVITIDEWDGTSMAKWIIDTSSEDGWIYWGEALAPGVTTSNLLEAIQLIQQPDGTFYYVIHSDMEAVSYEELWSDLPDSLRAAWEAQESQVPEEPEVPEFGLFYSEGNKLYNEGTTSSPVNLTINLTSPVGAATERYFTTQAVDGSANYSTDTWALDPGATGASLTAETAKQVYKVSIPVGATGTAKLTVGSYTVTINVTDSQAASSSLNVGETFAESGVEWRVLAKEGNQALIIAEHVLFNQRVHNANTNWDTTVNWGGAELCKALNGNSSYSTTAAGEWYAGLDSAFKSKVVPTTIKTKKEFDGSSGDYITLADQKFFLLSEDEVYGTSAGGDTANNLYPGTTLFTDISSRKVTALSPSSTSWWLRSPRQSNFAAALVSSGGGAASTTVMTAYGVRPACIIDF